MIPQDFILTLDRAVIGNGFIQGILRIGDILLADTIEPSWCNNAKYTAIKPYIYKMVLQYSPKFHMMLPVLLNVPDRSGIMIHPGNSAKDTKGCILVGIKDAQLGRLKAGSSRPILANLIANIKYNKIEQIKVNHYV